MAYAYSAIDDLVQNTPKQDIFGQQPQSGSSGAGTSATDSSSQGAPVKTSTEGQVQSATGASTPPSGQSSNSSSAQQNIVQPSSSPPDPSKAMQAAYKANEGKTQQPAAISTVQDQLNTNSQKLQDEANKYVSSQEQNQNYAVDQNALKSAVSGDTTSSDQVRNLLNRNTINSVDQFKPSDVTVADTNLLNTSAGLQNLVARGQGPTYTTGMGAFDVQALRSSPNFQNLLNMIQSQQSGLQKQAQDLTSQKQQEVQDYGQNALTQAQADAKQYLNTQADQINQNDLQQAQVANQRLALLRQQGDSGAEQAALAQARAQVTNNLQAADPRAVSLINQVNVDPRTFGTVAQDYGSNDFVTADQANQFNQIMSLLGNGGQVLSAANPRSQDYSIDQTQLQNAILNGAEQQRGVLDTGLKSQEQAILDAAQKRAVQNNDARTGFNLADEATNQSLQAINSLSPDLKNKLNPTIMGLIDPNKYIARPNLTESGTDVLNQTDVQKLNDLNQQLGLQSKYNVGQYSDNNPLYNFNTQGYLAALMPYLQQSQTKPAIGSSILGVAQKPSGIGQAVNKPADPTLGYLNNLTFANTKMPIVNKKTGTPVHTAAGGFY